MQKHWLFVALLSVCTVVFSNNSETLFVDIENSEQQNKVVKKQDTNSQLFKRLSILLKYGIPLRLMIYWASEVALDYQNYGIEFGISSRANNRAYELVTLYCLSECYYFLGDKVKYLDSVVDYCSEKIENWLDNQDCTISHKNN